MRLSRFVVLCLLTALAVVSSAQGKIRIATYNLEWFSEDANPERIANLKSVLNNVAPNIIGLQEVQSLRSLTQIFDDNWELGLLDDPREFQETAIAVRKPLKIESTEVVFKDPQFESPFPGKRDALRAVVVTPEGAKITVYVLHQKSRSGGRLQTDFRREWAAGLLAAFIAGKNDPNVAVVGDMNDAPDDVSVNILETGNLRAAPGREQVRNPLLVNLCDPLYERDAVTYGLNDLFKGADLSPFVPGAKEENEKWRGKDYRYPQDLKVTQSLFDQILVSPHLVPSSRMATIYTKADALRGKGGRIRFTENDTVEYTEKGTLASDHLPVYVDIDAKSLQIRPATGAR